MKRSLILVLAILIAITWFGVSAQVEEKTYTISGFEYTIPSGWLYSKSDNKQYHYAEQMKSPKGGYVMVAVSEHSDDSVPKELVRTKSLLPFAEGVMGKEWDESYFITDLDINGIDAFVFGWQMSADSDNLYAVCTACYYDDAIFCLFYANSDFSRSETEETAIEIAKKVKYTGDKTAERNLHVNGEFQYYFLENGTVEIRKYTGESSELEIPNILNGYVVSSIGEHAFSLGSSLTSVTIPNSINSIAASAFTFCYNLSSITIPDSVTSIGDGAFFHCGLKSATIGRGAESLDGNPFTGCDSLLNITLSPDNPYLTLIAGVLFSKPDNRLICYPAAFTATSYSIPDGTLNIGDNAFTRCSNLISLSLPESIIKIGAHAFYQSISLTNLIIPDSVISLGDWAALDCSNLTSVAIGMGLEHLGNNPFASCNSLTRFSISPNHPYLALIDGVLFSKSDKRLICYPNSSSAQSYIIPNGVQSIGNNAFMGCDKLTSVIIPEGVGIIGAAAFSRCTGLASINIPQSITSIRGSAFSSCSNLASLVIPESVTSIEGGAFYSCDKLTLTVTRDSYAKDYAEAEDIPYTYVDAGDALQNIQNAEPSSVELLTFSGKGAKIINVIELPNAPYRITFTQDTSGDLKVSYISGDRVITLIDEGMSPRQCVVFVNSGTYDFTIESAGSWELVFEPLTQAENLNISGMGDYVSDIFTIPQSTIINISGTYGNFENFIIYVYTLGKYGWSSDLLVNNLDDSGKTEALQKIITIAGETQVFFTIDFDMGNWSIKSVEE